MPRHLVRLLLASSALLATSALTSTGSASAAPDSPCPQNHTVTFAWSSPTSGAVLRGSTPATVQGTLHDSNDDAGGIPSDGIQYTIDGQPLGAENPVDPAHNSVYNPAESLTLTSLSTGAHTLSALVYFDGECETDAFPEHTLLGQFPLPITVNNTPIGISLDQAGSVLQGQAVGLSAQITAQGSPITKVTFGLDGADFPNNVLLAAPYSPVLGLLKVTNGAHTINVVARDQAGVVTRADFPVTVANHRRIGFTGPRSLVLGASGPLTIKVSPAGSSVPLALQQFYKGSWRTLGAKTYVGHTGKTKVHISFVTTGTKKLRLVTATGQVFPGISNTIAIRVH